MGCMRNDECVADVCSAQWGFHPGGWGKPPMDDYNRPLYGDVFGVMQGAEIAGQNDINKELWGEIEHVEVGEYPSTSTSNPMSSSFHCPLPCSTLTCPESDEESEEEDEDEPEAEDDDADGEPVRVPPGGTETPSGMETPSGLHSVTSTVPGGLETPDFIDLRKNREKTADMSAGPSGPRDLYTVIPERESSSRGFMGSTTTYDVGGAARGPSAGAAVLGADEGRKVSLGCGLCDLHLRFAFRVVKVDGVGTSRVTVRIVAFTMNSIANTTAQSRGCRNFNHRG